MKTDAIHIRDPFVLNVEGRYYLYGTRGAECWGGGLGLDVYVSDDLENWSEPHEVFRRPEGFWADRNFWAPEVHALAGAYYMFVSFKSADACRGTQILKAESPMGPFLPYSDGPVTPRDWECLDGTLYVDPKGRPYMVFCHEWVQVRDGEMCALPLSDDLRQPIGAPILLFRASEPAWAPKGAERYVTDGPFMYRTSGGELLMIWSSFTEQEGYCEAVARSDNGDITGHWTQDKDLLFTKDGGHGMIFADNAGGLRFICHQPNNTPMERPKLFDLIDTGRTLVRKG